MTQTKTKKALAMSVLSMMLCVAMLVGMTFAWFTDTASTSVNKIQAGKLDVELLMRDGEGKYQNIGDSQQVIFGSENSLVAQNNNQDTLWEPGKTQVAYLAVRNAGNLALKYNIVFNVVDNGLADALNYVIVPQETLTGETQSFTETVGDWNTIKTNAAPLPTGKVTAAPNGCLDEIAKDSTKINETEYFALVVHMDENAGNEYQGKDVSIDLTVVATQKNAESDSTGPDYDEDATYPVASTEDLESAITDAKSGDVVTVTQGEYALPNSIPEGITLTGAGADKTTLKAPATPSGNWTTGLIVDKPNVTIKDVTVTKPENITSDEYCGFVKINENGTTLDGVVINNNTGYASSVVIDNGVGVGDTATLKNTVLNGGFKPIHIVDSAKGTVILDNCEITGTYTLNVNSNSSQELVIKVTNSKLHGWTSYSPIKHASFINTEFSQGRSSYNFMRPYADTTLEKCKFSSGFKLGAGATGKTYVINDCSYDGNKVTAGNVQSLLLDMTGTDGTALRGCTIIVDGTTVTLS